MIIDAWMQFPKRQFLFDPMLDPLRRWPSHWRTLAEQDTDVDPEEALKSFAAEGVSAVVASAWWSPRGPMITNEEVADVVARHPDRVVGIASVDLASPMAAVRELRRCVKEFGKGRSGAPLALGLTP